MTGGRLQPLVRVSDGSVVVPAPVLRTAPDAATVDHQALLRAAHDEAAAIRTEAFQQGYAQGIHQAEVDVAAQQARLLDLARSLQRERERLLREMEPGVVLLALDVAEALLAHELATRPGTVTSLVTVAMQEVAEREPLRIRVHPDDAGLVRGDGLPEMVPDESLERGDCLVETGCGTIDARVSTRLGEMRRVLLEEAAHVV